MAAQGSTETPSGKGAGAQAPTATVRVSRILPAAPDVVFEAWTKPEILAQWFVAGAAVRPDAVELDVRVGGTYRIAMRNGDAVFEHWGTYVAVEPPHRLAFTWSHEGMGDAETLVTIDFKPKGARTELVLTHEHLPSQDFANRHEAGWSNVLDSLGHHLQGSGS